MFNASAENERLTKEIIQLREENAALKQRLEQQELEFYRKLFTRISINIEGGQLK